MFSLVSDDKPCRGKLFVWNSVSSKSQGPIRYILYLYTFHDCLRNLLFFFYCSRCPRRGFIFFINEDRCPRREIIFFYNGDRCSLSWIYFFPNGGACGLYLKLIFFLNRPSVLDDESYIDNNSSDFSLRSKIICSFIPTHFSLFVSVAVISL